MEFESLLKTRLSALLSAAVLALIVGLFCHGAFSGVEAALGARLWRILESPSVDRERRVVVVDIDQASVARFGAWPWPRARTAELFKRLTELGVAERIIDIAFPESKPGDGDLAAELLKTPTVLAQVLAIGADEPVSLGELQGGMSGRICDDLFPKANAAIGNAPGLRAAAAGHITPRIDIDGVIRQLPAVICYRNKAYPALALAAIAEGVGVAPEFSVVHGSSWLDPDETLVDPNIPGFSVPINKEGDILLPWWTPRESIISLSALDVMEGNIPPDFLQGAWVLVGATAFGVGDTVPTPQAASVSGVEVHAQLLTALLDARIPYRPQGALWLQIIWVVLSALILFYCGEIRSGLLRVYAPILAGGLLLAVTLACHAFLLWVACLWVPWALSGLFIILSVAFITVQGYLLSRAESDLLFRNLSSYLPAHVAKQIATQEPVGTLNAHHEQVIVLYADLRNFSSWCDQLPAEQVGAILHNFYSFAGKAIHQYGGVVEEYVGDAVMGVWRSGGCDLRPLQAAKAMVEISEKMFGAETEIDTLPPLAVGIGIEQGEILVGAFGLAGRRNYTLLGKAVATAMHLESMTGELSEAIICGENVVNNWRNHVPIMSLGRFMLKDRPQSTELFVPKNEEGGSESINDSVLTEAVLELD